MAADRIINVANGIVGILNDEAQPWSGQFTATRVYGQALTNTQKNILTVVVRHPAVQTEEESRGGSTDTYGIEIEIVQSVIATDVTAIDALVFLARSIARTFPPTAVLSIPDPTEPVLDQLQVTENLHQVFNPDWLAKGQFSSFISLAIQEFCPFATNPES